MNGSIVVSVLQGQFFHNAENCLNFKQLDCFLQCPWKGNSNM